jgi:hypothetical protein
MSPETEGILIGAGGLVLFSLLTWIGRQLMRLWGVPRRLEKIESGHPLILEGISILFDVNIIEVKCQKGERTNSDLDDAMTKMNAFKEKLSNHLTGSTVYRDIK